MASFYGVLSQIFPNKNSIFDYLAGDYYNNFVLQKEYFPYQFDSWKENKNYGLVDSAGNAIMPKLDALKNYQGVNGILHKNLLFVVDAFEEMKKYHSTLLTGNKINKSTPSLYVLPQAVKSTEEIDDLYIKYIGGIYKAFSEFLRDPIYNKTFNKKNVTGFDSFLNNLTVYLKMFLKGAQLTRSGFALGQYCNPNISGITISLADKKEFVDYATKADSFIADPNFEVFLDTAKRYGFYIDKNIPWRLVCDLGSQVTLTYARLYGIKSTEDIHKKFYHKIYKTDIEVLKNVLIALWNTYVTETGELITAKDANNCSEYFIEISQPQQISIENFNLYFDEKFMLRFYLFVKTLETYAQITQKQFELYYTECLKINKYVNHEAAIDYINQKILQNAPKHDSESKFLTNPEHVIRIGQERERTFFIPELTF